MKETPEEKLLRALFGQPRKKEFEKCSFCGRKVDKPIYFNDLPYHASCLSKKLGGGDEYL